MLRRHVSSQPLTNTSPPIEVDSVPNVFRKSFINMRFIAEAVLSNSSSTLDVRSCCCNLIGNTERQLLRYTFQYQSGYQATANFEILEVLIPYAAKVFCSRLKIIAEDLFKNEMILPARAMYTEVRPSLPKDRLH